MKCMDEKKHMEKKMYNVPEGYFEDLNMRLMAIPDAESQEAASPWTRVTPYLALAASFVAIVFCASVLLRKTASVNVMSDMDYMEFAALIPETDPYSIYDESFDDEGGTTVENIEDYLIYSGISLESIGYIAENYE